MSRVAIVDGVRTPIGALGGALKDLPAQRLIEITLRELIKRTNLNPKDVDEVIFGCCGQSSDAPNIARVAALMAEIPIDKPAYTVARNCASGMQAIVNGYLNIITKNADVQIVGGTESMSNIPFVSRDMRFGKRLTNSALVDSLWEGLTDPICNQIMGRTAENLVEEFKITREEQDKYSMESHKKAFKATREGKFKEEIVQVSVPKKAAGRQVAPELVTEDECINVGLNLQMMSLYPTVFKENGTVTPANSCPISDGACSILIMSEEKAKSFGYQPLGYIKSYSFAGLEPHRMGLGPSVAVPLALQKAGMKLDDIQLIELNEAFAAQVIACERTMKLDMGLVNVNGGAIALGHPVGFTGSRIVLTLLKEMKKRNLSTGLATLCVGGGQGAALIVER